MAKNPTPTEAPAEMQSDTMDLTVNGLSFTIKAPYAAGHVLTDIEAAVLNRTRAENIGNNSRKAVKELANDEGAYSDEAMAAAAKIVAEADAEYQFTRVAARGSVQSLSDTDKEARKIARTLLMEHIKNSGKKRKDVGDDKFEEALLRIAESDEVQAEAKRRVEKRGNLLDNLDLG